MYLTWGPSLRRYTASYTNASHTQNRDSFFFFFAVRIDTRPYLVVMYGNALGTGSHCDRVV